MIGVGFRTADHDERLAVSLCKFEETRRRRAGQDDDRLGAVADQHLLGGEQLVFRLAGVDEDRDAAALDQAFGKRCRQMCAKTQFRPGRDDADEAALIGKHAARQVVDVVAELLRRPQYLFARRRSDAGTRREGA